MLPDTARSADSVNEPERISDPAISAVPIIRADAVAAVRRALRYVTGDRSCLEPSLDQHPTVAFNLMTLAMLCGTPLMPGLAGHVVMIEEVSEHLYAIDRLMFHVTSHLGGIAGLRLGRVSDVPENDRAFGSSEQRKIRRPLPRVTIAVARSNTTRVGAR